MRLSRMVVALALTAAAAAFAQSGRLRAAPPRLMIDRLPLQMDDWQGRNAGALDPETLRVLGADAYLNRTYEGNGRSVGLYVAYYAQQRPGVSIHSPLHCLPGTGWETLDVATRSLRRADGSMAHLRRLVVRKDRNRDVVLYWYAVHGRTIASELASKAWLLHDSLRYNRSDAALVRIVVPIDESIASAEGDGLAFTRALLPRFARLWS